MENLVYTDDGWVSQPQLKTVDISQADFDSLHIQGLLKPDTIYLISDVPDYIPFPKVKQYCNYVDYDDNEAIFAKFTCIYCGTQDFEDYHKHTPHCPNCGALMMRSHT